LKRYKIVIVDFGLGNHSSIHRAVENLGFYCTISSDPKVILNCDHLILPGVGSFPAAMQHINKTGLTDCIYEAAKQKKQILGICLGMQLLTDGSTEFGFCRGLSLIPGKMKKLAVTNFHIGWNTLVYKKPTMKLRAIQDAHFYFNHSFVFNGPNEYCLAHAENLENIPAIIKKDNIVGMQFHPEKSQSQGRELLSLTLKGELGA
jgi:imidazole glycerol phosphate synthase glutamine amidotransferase subunit